ncbi:MAG: hypothetical protein HY646_00690 [Acidobacteria bacterium]|nr:hypothetical protein [Acidobacteriota bacterium]
MNPAKVVSINERAFENLKYIRETMERAGAFTAVPGWGGILMGVSALLTAFISGQLPSKDLWFATWLGEAALAFGIGAWAMIQKAKAVKSPILYGPGRKFAVGLCPAMIAGAVLTGVLYQNDLFGLMPGTWLLLYGVAVVTGGAFSVRVVPIMGVCFMVLGAVALFSPLQLANWFMAIGFGGLHVAFGVVIARRYGG